MWLWPPSEQLSSDTATCCNARAGSTRSGLTNEIIMGGWAGSRGPHLPQTLFVFLSAWCPCPPCPPCPPSARCKMQAPWHQISDHLTCNTWVWVCLIPHAECHSNNRNKKNEVGGTNRWKLVSTSSLSSLISLGGLVSFIVPKPDNRLKCHCNCFSPKSYEQLGGQWTQMTFLSTPCPG